MKRTILYRMFVCMLALVMTMSAAVSASAFSFTVGETVNNIGTVVTAQSETVAQGLEYTGITFTDSQNYGQTMHAMEFNPNTTGYIPMVYQAKPSYGKTVEQSIAHAQQAGYEVLGGINGEFGSANTENWGTLDSRMITNGRIIADSEYRDVMCLAFDKQGKFQLTKSQLSYHFYIEGKEVLNAESGDPVIGSINKRYVGTNWWSPYCYFDYATGGATYTNEDVKGVEVVFNKLNGTELTAEGVLQGEVVSVNTNAYATPMTENQFVLYAQNGSANYGKLAGLTVGQQVQIYAEELNKESKEIMKHAVTVTAATYPIVVDGVDNTDNTPNAEDIYMTRAQRTAIGVKADGTLVFVCLDGRGDDSHYNKGVTLPELANIMISLGCEYAVNLDGGGSTTFVAGDETKITYGRGVSSSILICKRNDATASPAEKTALADKIAQAQTQTYPGEQQAIVSEAIKQAQAVYDSADATTADYVRERMDLATAMGEIPSFAPKTYISLNAQDWSYDSSIMQAANKGEALVLNNTNNQWPLAAYACDIQTQAGDKLFFDITVAGQAVITLTANGAAKNINALIAPNSLDSGSGDIIGNGQTFKGVIDVDQIVKGGFDLSTVSIQAVGSAGSGSEVTIRTFEFRRPFTEGDVDGDCRINSNDARLTILQVLGKETFDAAQQASADLDESGAIDMADARAMLQKSVGLRP